MARSTGRIEHAVSKGERRELSPREQIFNSEDPQLISKYALKYLAYILALVFLTLASVEIFTAIDFSSTGDALSKLTGLQKGMIGVGGAVALAVAARFGVPELLKMNRKIDESILRELEQKRGQTREHEGKKREINDRERGEKAKEFTEIVVDTMKSFGPLPDKQQVIIRAFNRIFGANSIEPAQMGVVFRDVLNNADVKKQLDSMEATHRDFFYNMFDHIQQKPGRSELLQSIAQMKGLEGNDGGVSRMVITKALREAGFDFEACLKDPGQFDHDQFMSALSRLERSRYITYKKGADDGVEAVFGHVHQDHEVAKKYDLKVDREAAGHFDRMDDVWENEEQSASDVYDDMAQGASFKFDISEMKRGLAKQLTAFRDPDKTTPFNIRVQALQHAGAVSKGAGRGGAGDGS